MSLVVSRAVVVPLTLALLLALVVVPDAVSAKGQGKEKDDPGQGSERQGHGQDQRNGDPHRPPPREGDAGGPQKGSAPGHGAGDEPAPPQDAASEGPRPAPERPNDPQVPPLNRPPVADFLYETDGAVLVVDAFDSFDPDGDPLTYVWDWGDGAALRGTDLEVHIYLDPLADHIVRLTVVDAHGATDSHTETIPGWRGALVADIVAWGEGSTLFVDGFGSDAAPFLVVDWTWDWGDGSTTEGTPIAQHRYASPGTYEVTLFVTDELGRTAQAHHKVRVEAAPPQTGMRVANVMGAPGAMHEAPAVIASTSEGMPVLPLLALFALVGRGPLRRA